MKTLAPDRARVVVWHLLALLLIVSSFVEKHMKAQAGLVLVTGLAAALFMLVALHGRYNLHGETPELNAGDKE